MILSIFPIVKYTGQPCLLPLNLERFVLSDEIWIGATVEPMGSSPCRD
jgi:hypothetical protein